ncbi:MULTISPECIES: small ribosomal subunit protein bS21 [Flagellimonas]|uniref:Small ribosomal subunit protein bS21 n=1 Tax=Flagellimonas hadalis TaxID=2597517 RepID=A0A5N5J3I7_9FLAO|nr:30S ribosomal protein S21 [Allomuricauda hadalis]KAB5489424.1 30S ribosomal protein S21 [Allomuricauda hadalis]RUA13379.1 MAG: 30S ribosomal protein S21 [Flavobacteriia bacterium]
MLIVKIVPGENIERALKRYRNKVRNTQQLKRIRNNEEFTKKSIVKRVQLAKAVYRSEYFKKMEE